MVIEEYLNVLRVMLVLGGGISDSACDAVTFSNTPLDSIIGKPYESKSDAFFRAATVITAPLAYSVLTLDYALQTIYYVVKSIAELLQGHVQEAHQSLADSGEALLYVLILSALVIASPLVNLIDFVAGGLNSLAEKIEGSELRMG